MTTRSNVGEVRAALTRRGVTERQLDLVAQLARERVVAELGSTPDDREAELYRRLDDVRPTRVELSRWIDDYLRRPRVESLPERVVDPNLTPGVYRVDDVVLVVKYGRQRSRLYAKRLVDGSRAGRLVESGDARPIEFEYAPSAIFDVRPEHRMSLDDAASLCVRYGRCVYCNRALRAAKSVRAAIGPVCAKMFRDAS